MTTAVSPEITTLIEEVVGQWTGEGRMFSAFVVSREVQRLGRERSIATQRHLVIGDAVHDAVMPKLGDGTYTRTLQSIPGAPAQAFVYHPHGTDSTDYPAFNYDALPVESAPIAATFGKNASQPATPAVPGVPANAVPAVPANVASGATDDSSTSTGKAKDRLNVPTFVSKAAGFSAGNDVFAYDNDPANSAKKPCLVLVKDKIDGQNPLTEYKVSTDGRIRITPAILKIAGLDGDQFDFEGDDGKITVTVKK